jgi:hypothetical protein
MTLLVSGLYSVDVRMVNEFGAIGAIRLIYRARGSLVVKVLGYKPEGRGFETR